MRNISRSSAALILSASALAAALLAGCASDTPPPAAPVSAVSVGPSASSPTMAPAPSPMVAQAYAPPPAQAYAQFPEAAIPAGRLSLPPIPLRQTRPMYPEDLRQNSTEGYAIVGFVVEPDGSVGYAQTISATNQEFGDSALTAVRGWGFQPGRLNGQLVKSYMEIPVYFTLAQYQPVAANPAMPYANPAVPTNQTMTPVEVTIPPLPNGVYDVSEMDQYPTPVSQPSPEYPAAERRSGNQGYATVLFIVEADGSVSNILAVRATDSAFGDSAAAAVGQWRFRPGTVHGQPVRCRVIVPIQFTLNN